MIDNNTPGNARASPEPQPSSPQLSGRVVKRFANPRLEKGGELFAFDTLEIFSIEAINLTSDHQDAEDVSEPELPQAKKTEVSIMLILQMLTVVLTASALIVSIASA